MKTLLTMKKRNILWPTISSILFIGFFIPEDRVIPVQGATASDWNKDTFWYEPWGVSGVHKGIDIFAKNGTSVLATTNMLILYRGEIKLGGKVVLALGPKWRLHYFAHLESYNEDNLAASKGELIGTVGDSGNAVGKAPHLHYSIISIFPLLWEMDKSTQGYKKAFYINPIAYFEGH